MQPHGEDDIATSPSARNDDDARNVLVCAECLRQQPGTSTMKCSLCGTPDMMVVTRDEARRIIMACGERIEEFQGDEPRTPSSQVRTDVDETEMANNQAEAQQVQPEDPGTLAFASRRVVATGACFGDARGTKRIVEDYRTTPLRI